MSCPEPDGAGPGVATRRPPHAWHARRFVAIQFTQGGIITLSFKNPNILSTRHIAFGQLTKITK